MRRVLRIGVGFLLSAAVAGAILGLISFAILRPANIEGPLDALVRVVGASAAMGFVVGAIALLPAAAAIYVAERYAIRRPAYFILAGAAVPLVFIAPNAAIRPYLVMAQWPLVALLCGLGAIAGLVYWSRAGRSSGDVRPAAPGEADGDAA
jgi:hypothetical protein